MVELRYVIADKLGIHARPAGLLVKRCSAFACNIQIGTPEKMVDAKRVMGVMGLAVKHGTEIIMTFDGSDAKEAAEDLESQNPHAHAFSAKDDGRR